MLIDCLLLQGNLYGVQRFGLDDALHAGETLLGLNHYVATPCTVRLQGAGIVDFVFRTQADLAALSDDHGGGLDGAAVLDEPTVQADLLADQRTKVDGLLFDVADLDLDGRLVGIGDGDALAGREQYLAFGGVNEAGVFYLRGDQDDLAATGGSYGAFVLDTAGTGRVVEFEFAGEVVGILDLQGRNQQSGDINLRALAEGDAVGVDEYDAAIRLQAAEDLAGVAASNAVQHLAAGALLDEAGQFAAINVKALPVDDGAGGVGDRQRFTALLEDRLAGCNDGVDGVGR